MAYKIVNGKLVKITDQADFGTPAQKKAGRRITGTLGLPQTKQQAAKQLSQTFAPTPPSAAPSAPITFGPAPTPPLPALQPSAPITLGPGPVAPAAPMALAPDTALRTGQILPTAPQFLSPGAAQAMRSQGITPSTIIPQVAINAPLPSVGLLRGRNVPIPAAAEQFRQEIEPLRQAGTLPRFPSLASAPIALERGPAPQTRVPVTGTVGTGNALDQQLLNLAATDPERLRERARFINISRDRGAQIDVGVALTAEAFSRGQFPDVMTDAVASRLATLYGYDNFEDMMADLGYISNPDAPGTWLRREPSAPGMFGTTGDGGGGTGGIGFGGRRFIRGAVPRSTRGRGFGLGLTNWRI